MFKNTIKKYLQNEKTDLQTPQQNKIVRCFLGNSTLFLFRGLFLSKDNDEDSKAGPYF